MKNILKKLIFTGCLLALCLIVLQGCKTSLVNSQKIKEDLWEETLSFNYYPFQIKTEDNIKKIKIVTRETNRRDRLDLVTFFIEAEDQYVLATGTFQASYQFIIDEGWNLTQIRNVPADEQLSIKLKRGITDQDIPSTLADHLIPIEINTKSMNWRLSPENMKSLEIKSQETNVEELSDEVELLIYSENEYEMVTTTVRAKYEWTQKWQLLSLDVLDSSFSIKHHIDETTLKDYIKSYSLSLPIKLDNGITQYNWVFYNDERLEKLVIVDQQISQEDHINTLTGYITSTQDNMRIMGDFLFEFSYTGGGNWLLTNLTVDNPEELSHELIIPFQLTSKDIIETINGIQFSYGGSWFYNQYWNISSEDVSSFESHKILPINNGSTIEVYGHITLTDEEKSIEGEVKIVYDLVNGNWALKNITRVGDFIEK